MRFSNVNLVVNGKFENVDLATTGDQGGPRILDWTGPNVFAFSHNGSASSAGVVPDLADGADPPGAGNWYFAAHNLGTNAPDSVAQRRIFYQDIDVSTGPTAAAIASSAGARFTASAWFSGRLNEIATGQVGIDFYNSQGDFINSHSFGDPDVGAINEWSLTTLIEPPIHLGTAMIRVSVYGLDPFNSNPAPDEDHTAYIDNVELVVTANVPEPSSSALAVIGVMVAVLVRRRDSRSF